MHHCTRGIYFFNFYTIQLFIINSHNFKSHKKGKFFNESKKMIQLKTRLSVVYNRSPHIVFVLGIFPKATSQETISQVATFQICNFPIFAFKDIEL